MLHDFPQDFFAPPWLSKPSVGIGNGVKSRPPQLCLECGKPLPEVRSANQVACPGACQDARTRRTQKKARDKLNKKRRAERLKTKKAKLDSPVNRGSAPEGA
jgi:hypothetical protein